MLLLHIISLCNYSKSNIINEIKYSINDIKVFLFVFFDNSSNNSNIFFSVVNNSLGFTLIKLNSLNDNDKNILGIYAIIFSISLSKASTFISYIIILK